MPYTQAGLPWAPRSDTSHDAAVRAKNFAFGQRARVLAWVRARGRHGATMGEAEREMPIKRSSACGRFNELETAGEIIKTSARRNGCAVYQLHPDRGGVADQGALRVAPSQG